MLPEGAQTPKDVAQVAGITNGTALLSLARMSHRWRRGASE